MARKVLGSKRKKRNPFRQTAFDISGGGSGKKVFFGMLDPLTETRTNPSEETTDLKKGLSRMIKVRNIGLIGTQMTGEHR